MSNKVSSNCSIERLLELFGIGLFRVEVFIKSTLGVCFFFRNILDRAFAVLRRSVPKSDEWSECLEIKKLCLKRVLE
jgi:hypothetical protein